MKKQYIIPVQTIVKLNVEHQLLDMSDLGSASISSEEADGDAFVKDRGSSTSYNVWNDDWSK
ncbi:MAG: hypothetical protein IJS48_06330 [Prevotella sp.]|nr:hypothetical protein [Prevotella sp.]